jgi:abequosyltransferase
MAFDLSVCILSYNRSKELAQLLNSIAKQVTDDIRDKIEICISDDASIENIEQVVESFKNDMRINYFRFEQNQGHDINYLKVVEMSDSPYCWVFGNDDIMLDGALKYIYKEIQDNPDIDIFIADGFMADADLSNIYKRKFRLIKGKKDFTFDHKNTKSILLLGNSSEMIIKKDKWMLYTNLEDSSVKKMIGCIFIQVFIMCSMIKNGSKLKSLVKPVCIFRGGNGASTFLREGVFKRVLYDIRVMKLIPEEVFGKNSKEAKYMANQLMFNIVRTLIIGVKIKSQIVDSPYHLYKDVFVELFKSYKTNLLLYLLVLPSMLMPSFVYKIFVSFYRGTIKRIRKVK